MEKTGCKIICGAPTTLAVKGLMMMMMMMMMNFASPRSTSGLTDFYPTNNFGLHDVSAQAWAM